MVMIMIMMIIIIIKIIIIIIVIIVYLDSITQGMLAQMYISVNFLFIKYKLQYLLFMYHVQLTFVSRSYL